MEESINIEKYRGWAIRLAARFAADTKEPVLDTEFYSDACLGLVNAATGFDPDRGFDFSTYARKCIKTEICRGIHRRRSQRTVNGVVVRVQYSNEIASKASDPEESIAVGIQRREELARLAESIEHLSGQYRAVIDARLAGKTLEEIGVVLGVSKEMVRRIEERASVVLRQILLARSA